MKYHLFQSKGDYIVTDAPVVDGYHYVCTREARSQSEAYYYLVTQWGNKGPIKH